MFWPMPLWSCDHAWKTVGRRYAIWTSTGTVDTPPPDAPQYAECVCMKCGGYADQPVASDQQPVATDPMA
jgi:hypothetical protein